MDIMKQSELFLRDAGFETWTWTGASPTVTCFENQTIVGFIHLFDTAESLIESWEKAQALVLARHAAMLRNAGIKAWNVYSIFSQATTRLISDVMLNGWKRILVSRVKSHVLESE